MKIIWKEWDHIPESNSFGHGLLFVDTRYALCSDTVAWVKGFSWYKGEPEFVEVYCIKPDDLRTEAFLREVKKVVVRSILEKEIGMEPVYNNILRVSNA